MKGVVLAGGLGTRLLPLTKVTNKHLLPVYDKPMIYYPIQALVNAGIRQIMVVVGGKNAGDFVPLLANGREFGLREISYAYQEREGGIAEALGLTEDFADHEPIMVILGDNVIQKNVRRARESFEQQGGGARILLKEVPHPERFGVPEIVGGRIVHIEEKPKNPKSRYAVIGIYMYDARVYEIIKTLKPSARGELEITDVNNDYLRAGQLYHEVLDGWWIDAGSSPDHLFEASRLIRETGANNASS